MNTKKYLVKTSIKLEGFREEITFERVENSVGDFSLDYFTDNINKGINAGEIKNYTIESSDIFNSFGKLSIASYDIKVRTYYREISTLDELLEIIILDDGSQLEVWYDTNIGAFIVDYGD